MAGSRLRVWRPAWPCDPHDVLRPLRRGAGDPTFRLGSAYRRHDTVWRASMTPDGAATLRMTRRPAVGAVELEAWGPGGSWVLDHAPGLLGAHDDVRGFQPSEPMVRAAWSVNPHWRVPRSGLVLEALVAAVVEQKVTGHEAWTGWRRLLNRYGRTAPGPGERLGMRCLPPARELALVPSWEWLRCRIDPARSRTIVRAARVAPSLERTLDLPLPDVEPALTSLTGVGVWTAAEVRQRAHGDADAVSFGDYHVAAHVGWALLGEPIGDVELEELLEPDRPHRYRVQHVVTTRMRARPRRGPRMAPRAHLPG